MAATMADEMAQLKQLQAGMNAAYDNLFKIAQETPENSKGIANAKEQISTIAQITMGAVLGPAFSILGMTSQHHGYAAVRIALDLNLFEIINKPTTLAEITQKTDADPSILQRILRAVSSIGYLKQTTATTWEPTPLSQTATVPSLRDWLIAHFDERMVVTGRFPAWLKEHGYKNAGSADDNVLTEVLGGSIFDFYERHPEAGAIFDSAMSMQEQLPPAMAPPYPFSETGSDNDDNLQTDSDAVTLVDLGGGLGQAIKKLRAQYPDLKGRFILQDLPKTIGQIDAVQAKRDGMEIMAHDFFTAQPVKGAKYYHLRRVLHDWNDDASVKILEATRAAMEDSPTHSRLLVHDFVLPDVGCGFFESMIDLIMMQVCGGMERTESQWHDLLGRSRFKILKIWRADVGNTAVIEATLT